MGRHDDAEQRLMQAQRGLAQQLTGAAGARGDERFPYRTGTVTSTSPLQVTYPGESPIGVGRLASYTPTNGDIVLILTLAPVATILGKLV